jgi:hypothetical protein
MWFTRLMSFQCCGGPVLGLSLLCLGFGVLFLFLSAGLLGMVFIAVGAMAEGLCLCMARSRCRGREVRQQVTG